MMGLKTTTTLLSLAAAAAAITLPLANAAAAAEDGKGKETTTTQEEVVLGAFIFSRHGDRTAKVLAPTNLTSLGADQVFRSGSYYRSRYVAAADADASSSSSSSILGLERDIVALSQLSVTAPVDNVLQSSAQAFVQGLYPPVLSLLRNDNTTTSSSSSSAAPLGGYQYIPINIVSSPSSSSSTGANAENNAWLQGSSGCPNAVTSSNNYRISSEYQNTYSSTLDFYQNLYKHVPAIADVFSAEETNYKNAYAIWDYVNVATIHNTTITTTESLSGKEIERLKSLADIHEWNHAYNASEPIKIRAVAGSTLAGQVLDALNRTLMNTLTLTDDKKTETGAKKKNPAPLLNIQFGPYGTFASFFGLAQLDVAENDNSDNSDNDFNFRGIVDYASTMVFELVSTSPSPPSSSSPSSPPSSSSSSSVDPDIDNISVRFLFSNGPASTQSPPRVFPLFGQSDTLVPWRVFVEQMTRFAIRDTEDWCRACGNSDGMGVCAAFFTSGNGNGDGVSGNGNGNNADGRNNVSLPLAGVVGALVTLVVVLGVQILVYLLSGLRLVKKSTLVAVAKAEA